MGRAPCCSKVGVNRGAWSAEEDNLLAKYIQAHGEGNWRALPKKSGLRRCGKSCRLRWLNYLRPCIKRGNITPDEEELIIRMHDLVGNRWSIIAGRVPGRTDNEIKNYWNTNLSKRLAKGEIDPKTHKLSGKDSSSSKSKRKQSKNEGDLDSKSGNKVQVSELIVPNVHNLKANLRMHGPKRDECRLSSPYSNANTSLCMAPSYNNSLADEKSDEVTENIRCCESEDGDNALHVMEHLGHVDECCETVGISHSAAHDDNKQKYDEFGDILGCFFDVGKAENEMCCSRMADAAMDFPWDDRSLKQMQQGEGAQNNLPSCDTEYCVNDAAAMWEPSLWYYH
uniref:Uncharacterized protein n=1 Tax=Araucaria cunninghamii TaxID=56994 RepID=A0A0D6R318_ARACU